VRIRYLTRKDLETVAYELARELFEEWLGPMPVLTVLGGKRGAGVLDGILSLPKQSAGGRPAYPSVFDKAAVLFRSLIQDHPFVDGNKRMAVASALLFLLTNGVVLAATDHELVEFALRVASGKGRPAWSGISQWIELRAVSQTEIEEAVRRDRLDELLARLPGRAGLESRGLLSSISQMESSPAEQSDD
jgi:death-on-curing protein